MKHVGLTEPNTRQPVEHWTQTVCPLLKARSTMAISNLVRHPKYYFENGTYIFRVEHTLYKLQHTLLTNESAVFAELFDIGSVGPEKAEGKTDENPIVLEGYTVETFDLLVEFKFVW